MASALTTTRVLDILQLGPDKSRLVESILPVVKNWLVDYLKNSFIVKRSFNQTIDTPNPFVQQGDARVWRYSETLSVDADNLQVNDSDSKFVTNEFTADTDILIDGSRFNDGVYLVDTVTAGTLTLNDVHTSTMTSENYSDEAFTVYQILFPRAMLLPVSKIVGFDMVKRDSSLKSFRLADYSEQYDGAGDYPPGLLTRLTPWKNMFA